MFSKVILNNDYPLAPDKIEIKNEMLSKYQLMISKFCSISIGNIKKLMPTYLIKKSMRTCNFIFETGIKTKKIYCILQFNKS